MKLSIKFCTPKLVYCNKMFTAKITIRQIRKFNATNNMTFIVLSFFLYYYSFFHIHCNSNNNNNDTDNNNISNSKKKKKIV